MDTEGLRKLGRFGGDQGIDSACGCGARREVGMGRPSDRLFQSPLRWGHQDTHLYHTVIALSCCGKIIQQEGNIMA